MAGLLQSYDLPVLHRFRFAPNIPSAYMRASFRSWGPLDGPLIVSFHYLCTGTTLICNDHIIDDRPDPAYVIRFATSSTNAVDRVTSTSQTDQSNDACGSPIMLLSLYRPFSALAFCNQLISLIDLTSRKSSGVTIVILAFRLDPAHSTLLQLLLSGHRNSQKLKLRKGQTRHR